jgi:hypothetical protein
MRPQFNSGTLGGRQMKPTIELWESVGLGLIVEIPSGVLYSNQTGGFSCLHPSAEGVFLPIRNDHSFWELLSPERELLAYFEGPKHRGAGATEGLDVDDADFIDSVLAGVRLADVVQVDRERLAESQEAWVRVLLTGEEPEETKLFRDLGPYPRNAVLTWGNSD